jgi:hypothetical protein
MRRALMIAVAAAATACGSSLDFSQNCSMKVAVNGSPEQTVTCFAAGAVTSSGNAVSLAMTGTLPDVDVAQFAITLPSPPSARTYGAADVNDSGGQVQTTAGALYRQSKTGSIGSFSVVLTSVNAFTAEGQTAYFIHGTATVTLMGQSGAPGTATMTATF